MITWHVNDDPEMAAEPAGRVEWTLTPANADGSVIRVTLRHDDLALSPKAWAHWKLGWVEIIDSLKSLLEPGHALPELTQLNPTVDASTVDGDWHRAQGMTANNSARLLQLNTLGSALDLAWGWRIPSGPAISGKLLAKAAPLERQQRRS